MEYRLRVAGTAIGELSEKIPSNIIALNELIKNAYDAGAKNVYISLDTKKQLLTIEDDGSGMNEEEISTLLQISKSNKKYGSIVNNRFVQGSKGLGFLSVFKFGDVVTWRTVKDKERYFKIYYNEMLKLDNVYDYKVIIDESEETNLSNGTIIEIQLRKSYGVEQLKEYLREEKNRDKILNSFIDSSFNIELKIDGDFYQTQMDLTLTKYFKDHQLFHVTYDSDSHQIVINYLEHPKYGSYHTACKTIPVTKIDKPKRFKLEIELMIYDFSRGRRGDSGDKLYIDPTNNLTDKLTPLIYVNKNLFNNYTLFDPEISRYKRSNESLAQMIGRVEIICEDEELQFNSDRTQFSENELTNKIKQTLSNINLFIQSEGSKIKNELKNKKSSKQVQSHGAPPESTTEPTTEPITEPTTEPTTGSSPASRVGGTVTEETNKDEGVKSVSIKDPILILNERETSYSIPIDSVDLNKYIEKAEDSEGNSIDINLLIYEINGLPVEKGILSSLNEGENKISISFEDSIKGKVASELIIYGIEKVTPLETEKPDRILIRNEAKQGYKIKYSITPITQLVDQLNRLYKYTRVNYIEVIACSLRSVFELAIYELEMSGKIEFNFVKKSSDRLLDKVVTLVRNISGNAKLLGEIHNGLGLNGYRDFKNNLDARDYAATIKKCHLGAHKSTKSLSERNLEDIGKDVALFLVIVNEILNNPMIDWTSLGSPWVIDI
ncbi:ATP-binding protein [Paenibacillus sp. UNC217MF]|uniref:ATP-binding protein n=1 Tax=Paenibacillus sp. UNC217MF TaxID=1449062 RepID=UPI0009E01429|nr:ATP-binding protein [Paenibacillus sp. UNC217MF]